MPNRPVGTLGTIDVLQLGNRQITDLTNLIQIHGYYDASGLRTGFYLPDGTLYQASGVSFKVVALGVQMDSQVASADFFRLAYNQNPIAANSTASTSAVTYPNGSASLARRGMNMNMPRKDSNSTIDVETYFTDYAGFVIPDTNYPIVEFAGVGTPNAEWHFTLYGYEV